MWRISVKYFSMSRWSSPNEDNASLRAACSAVLPALRGAMRALLHYHLGSTPLRTRQVMADVRKLLDRPANHP